MSAPAEITVAQSPGPAIYAAMAAIMRDVEAVAKDRDNRQQGFKYRGIDDIYNALHQAFARHSVIMTCRVMEQSREERQTKSGGTLIYTRLLLEYYFHALDGSSISTQVVGEGMDSADKSSNKAMSIGHKYALLQALLIPTEEQKDPDADSPPPSRCKPPDAPQSAPTLDAEQEAESLFKAPATKGMADLQEVFAKLDKETKTRLKPFLDRIYKPLAIRSANKRRLEALIGEMKLDRDAVKAQVREVCGATTFLDINPAAFQDVLAAVQAMTPGNNR